jgi:hypothetical protein
MWTVAGDGDHLGRENPPERERLVEMGAPDGFEDVVAAINPIPDDQPDVPAFWDDSVVGGSSHTSTGHWWIEANRWTRASAGRRG